MRNSEPAIIVDGVSKSFRLPHEKNSSLKSSVINFYRKSKGYENQHVLDNISFEIKKGEFFGIVGRNGSGKSTLLKLISQIYTPDKGRIVVSGKLTPFIELGVGFNPELSGRDNVFLNGALLGFSRSEMEAMYDEIVEFAELERFMDQKLKNYSSGMQVRLAFSIAIRGNAEILVLDEVLAVGDSNFQKKCFDYFVKLKRDKKTIILVTHSMSSVERFCDRALLLDDGKIVATGKPSLITQTYSDLNFHREAETLEVEGEKERDTSQVDVDVSASGSASHTNAIDALTNDTISVEISIASKVDVNKAKLGIIIQNSAGSPIFATNTQVDKKTFNLYNGKTTLITYDVDNIFANGKYTVSINIRSEDGSEIYYIEDGLSPFLVGGRNHDYALTSPRYSFEISG